MKEKEEIIFEILKDGFKLNDKLDSSDEILNHKILKIVLSNPKKVNIVNTDNIDNSFEKITLEVFGDNVYISKYTKKQVFNENIVYTYDMLYNFFRLNDYSMLNFKQINIFTVVNDNIYNNEYSKLNNNKFYEKRILISKKFKMNILKKQIVIQNTIDKLEKILNSSNQNNEKKYLLKKEKDIVYNIPALIDIGVVNEKYEIVKSKNAKFKQINRFLEIIYDSVKSIIDKRKIEDRNNPINIIDFGCGKSYLTFVIYHYLKEIAKIDVKIIGLDLKVDVIKNCNNIANKYNYTDLKFYVGDIQNAKFMQDVDIIISLHACNTATDFSIINGVNWGAKTILAIPCCHHELNEKINPKNLNILSRYGLIQERISALLTDAIRANALIYNGYSVKILEFVDMEHTPKNILIKAEKTNISKKDKEIALNEIKSIKSEVDAELEIFKILKNI